MHRSAALTLLSLALAACGGSASSSNPSPSPAPSSPAAAPAASAGGASETPCAGGNCRLTVSIPQDAAAELARRGATYKLYNGCPRTAGFNTVAAMQTAVPMVAVTSPVIPVSGALKGRYATVGIFFGSAPARYAVVDFGANPTQKIDLGYLWGGSGLDDDRTVIRTNQTNERTWCK